MALTTRRKAVARKNVKKAQRTWQTMSSRARARSQPQGRGRSKPGAGGGQFFHIEVRPRTEFKTFRTQDVGKRGGIERVAGKRASGSWSTQKWLIAKDQAHIERGMLIGDTVDARRVLTMLGSEPRHIKADRFTIHGHTGMPADVNPTLAPRRAGLTNVQAPQKGRKWA
jgi:plasmid stabilization system protein ParE